MNSEMETVIKTVSEFGVLIVIASLFVYTCIRVINIWLKGWESSTKDKQHDQLLYIREQVSEEVQRLIEDFLEDHDAGRLQVIEFSNSVMSVAYLPFKFLSCTYEVYKIGRKAKAGRVDHLSTSLFTRFLTMLHSADYVILNVDDDANMVSGALLDIMHDMKETNFLCCMLTTIKGKHIGFVSLNKDTDFTEQDITDIQTLAGQVSALLGVADK